MATVFNFQISSEGVFPNKKVDVASFTEEIQASSITATLVSVEIVGDLCVVTFATDLSAAEETMLSDLVLAHTAALIGEPHMIPYIWQVKNPAAGQAQTDLKVMGLANIIDTYKCMRPAAPVGLNIRLKNALTAGSITLTISKNSVATGVSRTLNSSDGRKKIVLLKTTSLEYVKGEEIGFKYSCSADMLPTLDNEVNINIEMAWRS